MKPTDYRCVTTVQSIRDYLDKAKVIAFDYETAPDETHRNDPKAALDSAKAHIVGCFFSIEPGTGFYVPVAYKIGTNIDQTEF